MKDFSVLVCGPEATIESLVASAREAGAARVEATSDGYRAVELAARTAPAVIVTSPNGTGPLSGNELVARLVREARGAPVLVVVEDSRIAAKALVSGASGGAMTGEDSTVLSWAIRRAAAVGVAMSPRMIRELLERFADSERRQREWSAELARSSAMQEEARQAKSDFIANVSHELRTPLTIIKGMANIMRSPQLDAETRTHFAARAEEAADRMTRMVNDLIALAELEDRGAKVAAQSCDLAPVIAQAAREAASDYPLVRLITEIPPTLRTQADPALIAVVVRHIVSNACKYSSEGAEVKLHARMAPEGCTVSVTDQGEGMNRDLARTALTQAFVPGEEIMRKERAGLGIGLHLGRQIVVAHGGILWADPLPAGGTRVAFVIPAEGPAA